MRKRVPIDQLRVGMHVEQLCGSWLDHPFWRSSFPVTDERMLATLRASGVRECWIDVSRPENAAVATPASDVAPLAGAGSAGSTAIEPPPAAAPVSTAREQTPPAPQATSSMREELARAATLNLQARQAVTSLFQDVRMGKALDLKNCLPLVDDIASSVWRQPGAFVSLARLKSRDDYTYLHSVAVCALMVALSRSLGHGEDEARVAGLAGLLHDIGKAAMPLDVLQKPGKLSDQEYAVMRQHPARGHELLVEGGEAGAEALDVCLHHHERWDGKGYPEGLAGERISILARMGAVCDVYDAITSNRPYKSAWDPADSLARMAEWNGHFEQAVFHAFVKTLGIYPVGSLVRLQSQRLAVVVEPNDARPLLPVVRAFFSARSGLHIAPVDVDLGAPGCSDRIIGRESNRQWNFRHLDELWAGRETLRKLGRL
jgi:HD-GYP domain-containing protein (c-di-GMP phosphodiesterase class II)